MFIKINNKQHLLDELNNYVGSAIVFHYICSNCNDNQVSYDREVDNNLINYIDSNDGLFVGLPCTECDYNEGFIDINCIDGFEII